MDEMTTKLIPIPYTTPKVKYRASRTGMSDVMMTLLKQRKMPTMATGRLSNRRTRALETNVPSVCRPMAIEPIQATKQ